MKTTTHNCGEQISFTGEESFDWSEDSGGSGEEHEEISSSAALTAKTIEVLEHPVAGNLQIP